MVIFTVTSLTGFSQYQSALGLKINHYKVGVNYKLFLTEKNALDLELDFHKTGLEFIGLYNWQVAVDGVEGLFWYYGVGANFGRWSDAAQTRMAVGIDGQIGLEFKPNEIPFAFSLDYTPNFSIAKDYWKGTNTNTYDAGFWAQNWAIGIKYTFGSKASSQEGDSTPN